MSSGGLWLIVLGCVLLFVVLWSGLGLAVWLGGLAARRAWDRVTFAYWVLRFRSRAALSDSIGRHPSGRR